MIKVIFVSFSSKTKPYATIFTIVVTAAIFVLQMQGGYLVNIKYGLNMLFLDGAYWQPLTTMFIHGNFMHLAMNMIVLFQFGTLVEFARGGKFFALLYYAGGIVTSLITYIFIHTFDMNVNVVGASGAICVIVGWIAQKDSFNRKGLIIAVLIISFLPMLINMNVAWYAHLIGFGVGWFIGKTIK